MIVDKLSSSRCYASLHPLLPKAFDYLSQLTLANSPEELVRLEGDSLFVVSFKGQGLPRNEAKLELHRRYVDIHYPLEGVEQMGWKHGTDCQHVEAPFDTDEDCALYSDAPQTWVTLLPGTFALVWPEEAHAPRVADGSLTKVIVKLLV